MAGICSNHGQLRSGEAGENSQQLSPVLLADLRLDMPFVLGREALELCQRRLALDREMQRMAFLRGRDIIK